MVFSTLEIIDCAFQEKNNEEKELSHLRWVRGVAV
jgi:hypothetical protein